MISLHSKHLGFLSILILSLSACTNYTCEDFKTGEYVYADSTFKDVRISRVLLEEEEFIINNKKTVKPVGEQTEVMTRDGRTVTDVYKMIWDGPCTYSLVFKSTDSQKDQFHTQYDTIRVNVLGIEGDHFRIRANLGTKFPEADLIRVD